MTQIMQQPIAAPGPVPADPSMAVSIRGLYRRYDDKVAVNGLSLDIPTGSFYG
ncbi:ABC transporter, partial [Ligilactobacillus salivarius]